MSSSELIHHSVSLCQSTTAGSCRQDFSVEELLASRKNGWRDWLCAAGTENLHISPDGDGYVATCRVGGVLGNVFAGHLALPKEWIRCTKIWCMCGADMQLRKARIKAFQIRSGETLPIRKNVIEHPDWVSPTQEDAHRRFPKTITWDLSRRCNYSCSYCHPSVSNQTDAHWSREKLWKAIDVIESQYCRGAMSKWVFTGGEPTLNPSFMDVVDRLSALGHLIHVQSNGSLGPDFFARLSAKACVGLSLHLESYNHERFLKTVGAMLASGSHYWMGVRIMVPPGYFKEAIKVRGELLQLPGAVERLNVNMSPLYQRLNQDQLQEYEKAELDRIIQFS